MCVCIAGFKQITIYFDRSDENKIYDGIINECII